MNSVPFLSLKYNSNLHVIVPDQHVLCKCNCGKSVSHLSFSITTERVLCVSVGLTLPEKGIDNRSVFIKSYGYSCNRHWLH